MKILENNILIQQTWEDTYIWQTVSSLYSTVQFQCSKTTTFSFDSSIPITVPALK